MDLHLVSEAEANFLWGCTAVSKVTKKFDADLADIGMYDSVSGLAHTHIDCCKANGEDAHLYAFWEKKETEWVCVGYGAISAQEIAAIAKDFASTKNAPQLIRVTFGGLSVAHGWTKEISSAVQAGLACKIRDLFQEMRNEESITP